MIFQTGCQITDPQCLHFSQKTKQKKTHTRMLHLLLSAQIKLRRKYAQIKVKICKKTLQL